MKGRKSGRKCELGSHIRNLCCTRSTRTVWESAAPAQITLQYSRMERTLEKYAASKAAHLNLERFDPVWKERIIRPKERFARLTMWEICAAKVSLVSSMTPRSLISGTCSQLRVVNIIVCPDGSARLRVIVNDLSIYYT